MTRINLPISYLKPDGTWRNEQDRLLCPYCGRIVHEQYTICTDCKTPFTGATWKYLREKFPQYHGENKMNEQGRCWCGSMMKDKPHNCIGTRGRVEGLLDENAKLRAEAAAYEKRIPELCAEYLDKLKAALLQIDAMKELLSQYQSNVHLSKHDASLAPMDCQIEPCPKTSKAILGTSEKQNEEKK